MPVGIAAVTASSVSFFFFNAVVLIAGFSCLEMVGNHSRRPQPIAHIKQFNFLL